MYSGRITSVNGITADDIDSIEMLNSIYLRMLNYDVYSAIEDSKLPASDFYDHISQRYAIDPDVTDHSYTDRDLIIKLTMNCNLECQYCPQAKFYGSTRNSSGYKGISFEHLNAGLEWLYSKPAGSYRITFYGGEPLLFMEQIWHAVEQVENMHDYQNTTVLVITNGTLIDSAFMEFAVKHAIVVVVSLDGDDVTHDHNRLLINSKKGSHSSILKNLTKFQQLHPEFYSGNVVFNCTYDIDIGQKHFKTLCKDSKLFRGNEIIMNPKRDYDAVLKENETPIIVNIEATATQHRSKAFDEIFTHIVDKVSNPYSRMKIEDDATIVIGGMCKVGMEKLFVDQNGRLEICDKITRSPTLGDVCSLVDDSSARDLYTRYYEWLRQHCGNCFASRVCHACYAGFWNYDRLSLEPDLDTCMFSTAYLESAVSLFISMQ